MRWQAPDIQRVDVSAVHVAPGRRPVNEAAIMMLMASIEAQGLHTPITVRHVDVMDLPGEGEVHGVPVLVAGRHRLEAARRLGWDMIPCVFLVGDERDARLWEIAENLHRADLNAQERAEHIAEWVQLTTEKLAQVGQVSSKGGRGNEGGLSAAVREIGVTRQEAQRAEKIAAIAPEAKAAVAADVKLANNQAALLRVAAEPSPERQLSRIRQEQEQAEAHAANRTTNRVIALTEAEQFADWIMASADLSEMPKIIAWVEGVKPKDLTAALRRLSQ